MIMVIMIVIKKQKTFFILKNIPLHDSWAKKQRWRLNIAVVVSLCVNVNFWPKFSTSDVFSSEKLLL